MEFTVVHPDIWCIEVLFLSFSLTYKNDIQVTFVTLNITCKSDCLMIDWFSEQPAGDDWIQNQYDLFLPLHVSPPLLCHSSWSPHTSYFAFLIWGGAWHHPDAASSCPKFILFSTKSFELSKRLMFSFRRYLNLSIKSGFMEDTYKYFYTQQWPNHLNPT